MLPITAAAIDHFRATETCSVTVA